MSVHDIKDGIASVQYWAQTIWKDRNWDHAYLLIMLRHKLKAMHSRWIRLKWHVGWNDDAHKMRICILLLDRLIEDNYLSMRGISGRQDSRHGIAVQNNRQAYSWMVGLERDYYDYLDGTHRRFNELGGD